VIPALILARGGSKGIREKNLREISEGVTLVGRCVIEAMKSKLEPVYVWSDSDRIRIESRLHGAETPERPTNFSGDTISTEATVQAFLSQENSKNEFDAVAVLQCTTPFLMARHIDEAVSMFLSRRLHSVVTVAKFTRFLGYPSHDETTDFTPVRPYRALRQEATPDLYMENGGLYLARRKVWLNGKRIGNTCGVVKMGWWESLEIDEPTDLEVARRLAPLFLGTAEPYPAPIYWMDDDKK
jgi:CMP-N-acetylneuraminic acid synthetase